MQKLSAFRKTGLFYTLLTALINLILTAVLSCVPGPNFDEAVTVKWLEFLNGSSVKYWGGVIPYVIPILFCLCYALWGRKEERLRKRAVSMPMFMALSTFAGWFANYATVILCACMARRKLGGRSS